MDHKECSLTPIKHSVTKWKVCIVQYIKTQPIRHNFFLKGSVLMVGGRYVLPLSFHDS